MTLENGVMISQLLVLMDLLLFTTRDHVLICKQMSPIRQNKYREMRIHYRSFIHLFISIHFSVTNIKISLIFQVLDDFGNPAYYI